MHETGSATRFSTGGGFKRGGRPRSARFVRIALCAALVLSAASGCARRAAPAPPPSPAQETYRETPSGPIIGYVSPEGAHVWRGAPFAKAPEGELRWRAPRPHPGWSERREALQSADRCIQLTNRLNESEGLDPGLIVGSEDCLYADIYAPPNAAPGAALPVMVWIHGGANTWGRASSYDGARLAVNENVIVVAVQYRLGIFGWFAHEALRANPEIPADESANFGTLDLIAALDWVGRDIAAYGGDPDNITIFGESAGGHNVASLLASPIARGKFHRAIIQSGSFDSVPLAEAESGSIERNVGRDVARRIGANDGAGLRAAPPEKVFASLELGDQAFLSLPRIIADGVALPASPLREAFASRETFNAVPVITGVNRDEMKLFQLLDPALTKRILGLFPVARDQRYYDALAEYTSRVWRIRAVDEPAGAMVAGGHPDIFAYRFDWDEGGRFLITDLGNLLGAGHAIEIPFVFNRFELLGSLDRIMFTKRTAESREDLSRAMGAYWASFARSGEPGDGGRGLPQWPSWGRQARLLRLDSVEGGGPEVLAGEDSLEALLVDLQSDPRLSDAERCAVMDAMGRWTREVAQAISRRADCPGAAAT